MQTEGFESIFIDLDALAPRIVGGAVRGLIGAADELADAARGSGAYEDQSGATRAGTTAYVVGGNVDGSGALARGAAEVAARNPGHEFVESIDGGGENEVVVVLTVPTDYADDLETKNAGAHAFIGPAMTSGVGALQAAALSGIAQELS